MFSVTQVKEQESLIGPFREQLEAFEMEHKALLNEKHDAENEAREMGLKYASILGHQNQKQKIKYLVDLQTKKFELIEVCAALMGNLCFGTFNFRCCRIRKNWNRGLGRRPEPLRN